MFVYYGRHQKSVHFGFQFSILMYTCRPATNKLYTRVHSIRQWGSIFLDGGWHDLPALDSKPCTSSDFQDFTLKGGGHKKTPGVVPGGLTKIRGIYFKQARGFNSSQSTFS